MASLPTLIEPPTARRLRGIRPSHVDLLTVQHRDVLTALHSDRRVFPDVTRSTYRDEPTFQQTYRWITRRMAQRCDTGMWFDPDAGAAFWLWACTDRDHLGDIVEQTTADDVLLHVRVATNRVLFTDFDAYHSILNRTVTYTGTQERRFADALAAGRVYQTELEATLEASYGTAWTWDELDDRSRNHVERTWEHAIVSWPTERGYTQACIAWLELDDLVSVYEP